MFCWLHGYLFFTLFAIKICTCICFCLQFLMESKNRAGMEQIFFQSMQLIGTTHGVAASEYFWGRAITCVSTRPCCSTEDITTPPYTSLPPLAMQKSPLPLLSSGEHHAPLRLHGGHCSTLDVPPYEGDHSCLFFNFIYNKNLHLHPPLASTCDRCFTCDQWVLCYIMIILTFLREIQKTLYNTIIL